MACLHQAQFCDASRRCGPLASFVDAAAGAATLFNSTPQVAMPENLVKPEGPTASRFVWFIVSIVQGASSLASSVSSLQSATLQSKQYLYGGVVLDVLRHQWKSDVAHWYASMLASIQETFVSTASKPTDPDLEQYLVRPKNPYAQEMCDNQFASFSLFGLYLTYLIGLFIIASSHAVEPILAILARRRRKNGHAAYTYLEWTANETLQLQRAAYQGIRSGTWTGFTKEVPKTKKGETLLHLTSLHTRTNGCGAEPASKATDGPQPPYSEHQRAPSCRGDVNSEPGEPIETESGLEISMTGSTATIRDEPTPRQ
ncbi:hypothetical protein XA68_12696 [Ophiocordyceps unilateralis]|uniref:Uncharacterized protein n=1 Tax=Ophiocordyceps unilateralis TaxID=268505 RepID=A0A2A9PP22_OPHUN|nr:hypothetical protein XA68_12696 [Ophiocordyceps unilateralis]